MAQLVVASCLSLEVDLDDAVGLHGGDGDVGDPEGHEDEGGHPLYGRGAAQLAADGGVAPDEQDQDGDQGLRAEQGHGEAQAEDMEKRR